MTREEVWAFLEARARAWQAGDLDTIEAGYAPDVVLIAPGGIRLEGLATLRENNARYFAEFTDIRVDLKRVILEWSSWSFFPRLDI